MEQHYGKCKSNLQLPSSLIQQLIESESSGLCNGFCQSLHQTFPEDFPDVHEYSANAQEFQDLRDHLACSSCPVAAGNGEEECLSTRRIHKADREKLRRDKLNEQFSELASALDPGWPKTDKASILGVCVQAVKELRDELKQLKAQGALLLNESHDLTQEKNELREDKAALMKRTEQLQGQLWQRLQAMPPWMALDPSIIMEATAFPYPVAVPQAISLPSANPHQIPSRPVVNPMPYIPFPPALGPLHMHPSLQLFPMFGYRHGGGGNPYLDFMNLHPFGASHPHVERPYPIMQQPHQGSHPQMAASSEEAPMCRPSVTGIPVESTQIQGHGPNKRSKGCSNCSHATQGSSQHMVTDLQFQTPVSKLTAFHPEALGSLLTQDTDSEVATFEDREETNVTVPTIFENTRYCRESLN